MKSGISLIKTFSIERKILTFISFYTYRNYLNDVTIPSNLKVKYKNINDLFTEMTSKEKEKRPNCAEILRRKHFWALIANEIEAHNEIYELSFSEKDPYFLSFFKQLNIQRGK